MSDNTQAKPVSKALKRFFGVGDFGFTFMTNIDTFYSTFFFTNIAKLSLSVITVITTISAVVDAVLSCVYGVWMNKIKPQKWGRYRSWLVLTPWMVPFLFAFQFIRLDEGFLGIAVILIAMLTSRIAWNIPFIANLAMINIAGKTTEDRMALSSTRSIWNSLSNVLYSYVGPAAVTILASVVGEQNSYAAAAFVFGAVMAAGYYAHFKMFDGYEETGAEEIARLQKQATVSAAPAKVSAIKAITCNPHLISLLVASFGKYMAFFLINGMAVYYFEYIALDPGMMSILLAIANLAGIGAGYAAKHIVAKLNAKRTTIASYCLVAAALGASFLVYTNVYAVIGLVAIAIVCVTLSNACEPELYAACAGYSSAKIGADTTGTVMGLLTVPLKLGIVMRGILISAVLAIGGFDANIAPAMAGESVKQGICLGYMVIPAVVMVVSVIIMFFGYRLDKEKK